MAIDATQMNNRALNLGNIDAVRDTSYTPLQGNKAGADSGVANGVHFVVEEASAQKLQAAREDLSLRFVEREMPPIGDHKMGDRLNPRQAYFAAVDKWQRILPDAPKGEYGENLLSQLRTMRDGGILPSTGDFLKRLAEGSSDPSVQYALLETLSFLLTADDKDIQALLADARRTLLAKNGVEIRAGINIVETVNAQTQDPAKMQELRDLYRAEVDGFKSPQDCFSSLMASRGPGRMDEALKFLIDSAGVDIRSASPSRDPVELSRILTDLKNVQTIKSSYDEMAKLLERMSAQFGEAPAVDAEKATAMLMDATRGLSLSKEGVSAFVDGLGAKSPQAKYDCTREFLSALRRLPDGLFAGGNAGRLGMVDATLSLLDDLTAEMEGA